MGVFGASMAVELVNDGPVTIVLRRRQRLGSIVPRQRRGCRHLRERSRMTKRRAICSWHRACVQPSSERRSQSRQPARSEGRLRAEGESERPDGGPVQQLGRDRPAHGDDDGHRDHVHAHYQNLTGNPCRPHPHRTEIRHRGCVGLLLRRRRQAALSGCDVGDGDGHDRCCGRARAENQNVQPGDLASVERIIRSGQTYANIHTANSPAGEIRGQVKVHGKHGKH